MIIKNVYGDDQINIKLIKRMGNCIGFAFVLTMLIPKLFSLIVTLVLDEQIIYNDGFRWYFQVVLSALVFTIPFIIITKPANVRLSTVCNYAVPKKGKALPLIFCGLGVCMLANILCGMAVSIFEALGISDWEPSLSSDISSGIWIPIISLIAGAFLPALLEEFALRGVVLGILKRFGNRFAIVVSAALFGIMHGNIKQSLFAFIIGLYLGFATMKSGSVWTAVIIHALNNFFSFFLDIVAQLVPGNVYIIVNQLYFLLAISLGIFGIYLARYQKDIYKIKDENKMPELSLSQKITYFFASPGMIVYIIFVIYDIFGVVIQQFLAVVK